jgi:hypothetical protein
MLPARTAALIVCAFLPITGARAQETACGNRTLPVAVRDSLGNPIRGLAPSDFDAKIHGKPVPVISVQPDLRLHRMVILLDTSGSMRGLSVPSRRWNLAIMLVLHAAEATNPRAKLALLLFGERVNEVDDFSKGNAAIIERLNEIATDPTFVKKEVHGRTALYDSVAEAFNLLNHPTSADVLYVVSDCHDNSSRRTPSGVGRLLEPSGVRLFSLALINTAVYKPSSLDEFAQEDYLRTMKESGGAILEWGAKFDSGPWVFATEDNSATEGKVLTSFYRSMLENDLVTIQVPPELHKRERLDLKLSEADRKKWKDAQILYPSEIEPCALPPRPQKAE